MQTNLQFQTTTTIIIRETYKADSVHNDVVKAMIPEEVKGFVSYCKTVRIPEGYGGFSGRICPPRVLNECIWLEGNGSSGG